MAIKKIKNKNGTTSYKVTIYNNGQYVYSKSFKRRIDADEWETKQKAILSDNQVGRPRGNKKTLDEFFEEAYWPNKRIRPSTAKEYRSAYDCHIRPVFGKSNLNDTSSGDWIRFKSQLVEKGLSPARANRVHTVASAIYKTAVKMGYSQSNPLSGIGFLNEPLRSIEYWSRAESNRFWNGASRRE